MELSFGLGRTWDFFYSNKKIRINFALKGDIKKLHEIRFSEGEAQDSQADVSWFNRFMKKDIKCVENREKNKFS